MNTMNQLMTQSRMAEVARSANHPARLAEHELRLARRGAGPSRSRDVVTAALAALPVTTAWVAALAAAVS